MYSKMLGFAKWNYPHTLNEGHKKNMARFGSYPEGTNIPLQTEVSRQMWAMRDKWIKPENTFCKSVQTL